MIARCGDANARVEFSAAELEDAYRNVPRVKSVDEDQPGQRFVLDLTIPQRDLPPEPPKPQPAQDTPADIPATAETAEAPAPDSSPDAAAQDASSEPLPS